MKKIVFFTEHPAPYWDNCFFELEKNAAVFVIYNKTTVNSKKWNNYIGYKGKTINLKSIFETIQKIISADVIIIGGIYLKLHLFMFYLSKILNKKVFLFSDLPEIKSRSKLKIILKRYLIYSLFSKILVASKEGIKLYINVYKIKTGKFIYFPYAWEKKEKSMLDFIENKSTFNIFISNRFLERKGYNILFEVIDKLNTNGLLIHFNIEIAGNGPLLNFYKDKYVNLYKNLKFLGWINYQDYLDSMKKCDIYIHPSLFEPFGIPIIDALNMGKIVISSDGVVAGVDYIKNEVNGFIYNKNKSTELYGILNNIIKSRYNLKLISTNASNSIPEYSIFIDELNSVI